MNSRIIPILISTAAICQIYAADDNITANVSLTSEGTLTVDDQATLSGPVLMDSTVTIDDQAKIRWTTAPTNPYWNLKLEDGLFLWDNPSHTSNMDTSIPSGDPVFIWYPDKATFRVGLASELMDDEEVGSYTVAIGKGAHAPETDAIAIGTNGTVASGSGIAIGKSAVSEDGGIAVGSGALARYITYPIALGYSTESYGGVSIGAYSSSANEREVAIGYDAVAWGTWAFIDSIAIGKRSYVNAEFSTSLGHEVITSAFGSVALGSGNIENLNQNNATWVATDELLVVGNGEDGLNQSNALVIYKNADAVFYGNVSVAGSVKVDPVGDINMGIFE